MWSPVLCLDDDPLATLAKLVKQKNQDMTTLPPLKNIIASRDARSKLKDEPTTKPPLGFVRRTPNRLSSYRALRPKDTPRNNDIYGHISDNYKSTTSSNRSRSPTKRPNKSTVRPKSPTKRPKLPPIRPKLPSKSPKPFTTRPKLSTKRLMSSTKRPNSPSKRPKIAPKKTTSSTKIRFKRVRVNNEKSESINPESYDNHRRQPSTTERTTTIAPKTTEFPQISEVWKVTTRQPALQEEDLYRAPTKKTIRLFGKLQPSKDRNSFDDVPSSIEEEDQVRINLYRSSRKS